ncbi:Os07g0273000, partial [Oryza sativa Japonica Group]
GGGRRRGRRGEVAVTAATFLPRDLAPLPFSSSSTTWCGDRHGEVAARLLDLTDTLSPRAPPPPARCWVAAAGMEAGMARWWRGGRPGEVVVAAVEKAGGTVGAINFLFF